MGIISTILIILANSVVAQISANTNIENTKSEVDNQQSLINSVQEGFTRVTENGKLSLWVNTENADIMIEDKFAGYRWFSNPINLNDDSTASNSMKEQLKAQLWVSFLDEIRNVVTVESHTHCVMKNTFEIRLVRKNNQIVGVKTTYDFQDKTQMFKISLQFTLENGYLEVSILYDEIEEYGTSVICSIDLLPNFGAGSIQDDGYLFIPDGSGALIKFEDSYKEASDYKESVYGRDPAVNLLLRTVPDSQTIRMPVFGIKKDNAAFIGVIDEGDAIASIRASSNIRVSSYSTVSASFVYRENDNAGIVDKDSLVRTVRMADKSPASTSPVVRYYFLRGEDADYSGMARIYQSYLVNKYNLKRLTEKSFSPLLLEIFGLTEYKTNFLGIPIKKPVVATTFKQAEDFIKSLKDNGVSGVSTALYGFQKGGYQKKTIAKESFDSKVGGKKGYKRLLDYADAPVYVSYDLVQNFSAVNSLLKGEKYIRNLNGMTVVREKGTLSSGSWNGSPKWLITSAWRLKDLCDNLLSRVTPTQNSGIVFQHMGKMIYNNFSPNANTDRQQLKSSYQSILKKSKTVLDHVAGECGNVYLLSGVDMMYEVPLESSRFQIISESVPFYSMVLHGYVNLHSENLGLSHDQYSMLLKCIESGVSLTYRATNCDAGKLTNTALSFLYNTQFSDWNEVIAKNVKEYSDIQKDLYTQRIIAHMYEKNLSITTYENGTVLIVNFTNDNQQYNGVSVQPKSVKVIG